MENVPNVTGQFLDLAAALEVAVLLKRRLVLPDAFDCSALAWKTWNSGGVDGRSQVMSWGLTAP